MKFNPITNELFTSSGELLKKLHCPFNKDWEEMHEAIYLKGKLCDRCDKVVVDTSLLDEATVTELIQEDPGKCLKVDLDQNNLNIIYESK